MTLQFSDKKIEPRNARYYLIIASWGNPQHVLTWGNPQYAALGKSPGRCSGDFPRGCPGLPGTAPATERSILVTDNAVRDAALASCFARGLDESQLFWKKTYSSILSQLN
jgi:hypothetical protein